MRTLRLNPQPQFEADRIELGVEVAVALLLQTPDHWETLTGRLARFTVAVAR